MGCHVLLQGIFSTQRWNQVSSGSCIASRLFPAEPPGKSIQGIQPYSNWSGLYPSLVRGNLKPLKFPKWKECLCCSRWAPLTTPSGFMLKRWFRLRLTSTCLRIGFGHNRKTSHRKRTHELGGDFDHVISAPSGWKGCTGVPSSKAVDQYQFMAC